MDDSERSRLFGRVLNDLSADMITRLRPRLDFISLRGRPSEEDRSWLQGMNEGASRTVLRLCGNSTAIDADAPEDFLEEVASAVQDMVIDELRAPWPLSRSGRVLTPASRGARGVWMDGDVEYCEIGRLLAAPAAS